MRNIAYLTNLVSELGRCLYGPQCYAGGFLPCGSPSTANAGRRGFLVLLASGVAINAWALFPSFDESELYVRFPEPSTPSAAEVNSAREGVAGSTVIASMASAKLAPSKPTMYELVTVRYPSPAVNVSLVPLRSKLRALLMLLYSQYGGVDLAALEAKLQALLDLPDSVLALLIQHPDLADLSEMLDAVFLATSDLSGVKTELDKIDVTSVPGPFEKIDVVKVNGKPAYIVHSPAAQTGTENAAGPAVSAPPPPGAQVTVTVVSQVEAPADPSATAFTVAPSSEPVSPPPAPAALSATAFTVAPSSEQFTPSPAPESAPTSTPTPEITKSREEPTGTPQTSLDDLNSGNKFEPGETVTERSADNSPATNSPATHAAAPSTTATGGESPAETGGVTGGGGVASPSDNESGGTPSGGGTSP
jgi:hypothetical protein